MPNTQSRAGFTLIDTLVTVAVLAVIMAAAVPTVMNVTESMKIGQAQRDVEVELNSARLTAVSSNRPMRVRFNCPAAGQYRMVELIGSPSKPDANDSASDRCSATKYKLPANDRSPITRPNHDGPVRYLPTNVSFGGAPTLEFWPDGTVHKQVAGENPWTQADVTNGIDVAVAKGLTVKHIKVTGLGKIQLQ